MSVFAVKMGRHQIALQPGQWGIGRAPENKIHLDDPSVSWHHATLLVEQGTVHIQDRKSRNGLFVNDRAIKGTTQLEAGDRVTVGSESLTLVQADTRPQDLVRQQPPATKPLPKLEDDDDLGALSRRERDVFERLAHGATQRAVAEALDLSVKTVETYHARIREKLGISSREELIARALQAGILQPTKRDSDS